MYPVVAILAGISIVATAACWLFDNLTEEEKKRNKRLKDEIDELKKRFNSENNNCNQNIDEIARSNFNKIKDNFLREIEFYKNEKKDIKKDLEKLSDSIKEGIENESISPYQKQSLLDNRNKVEDAKNRLDAYWKYLDWFEEKLHELEKYKKFKDIFDLEIPKALLPEDYLYLGKLAYITKYEIAIKGNKSQGWNKYNQKLSLNDYSNKNEIDIVEFYNLEDEFMILIDHTKDSKHFKASAIKGELYQHILEDMSFEVKPKQDEKSNQEKLVLLYKDIYLELKREDKLYPLKRYKEYDSFEVKIKEYDLLLKNIVATEKYNDNNQQILTTAIPVVFDIENIAIDKLKKLETVVENNIFEVLTLEDNHLNLKIDNYKLHLQIKTTDNLLFLNDISEMDINEISSNSFSIPYELIFMEKKIYDETYQELLLDKRSIFNEFLSFIHEQFSYMIYSNKTSNKDFDFFKKWQKIIDYQIEDNSFDIYELQYSKYKIENNLVVFYVSDLNEYSKKFQEKKSKEIIIVLNNTNLGFLDDYSIEDNKLITKIDLLKDLVNISENGKIFIKIKNYQAVLQKQKKALKDFSFSKIVNQDLKQLLISPNLISYKALVDNFELDFKNKNLTNNQKEIIKRAFNEKNIFLIQGPPGTGKTTIIKELIYQTIKQDNYSKILIVSQQNVAVDNVLYGIDKENREWFEKDGHSIVRVAPNENKIQYDNIKEYTVEKWFEKYKEEVRDNFIKLEQNKNDNEKFKNMYDYANKWMKLIYKLKFKDIDNEIKELLISKHQILGATCVGLANKSLGLDLIEFDIAIIDEAGRATAPELLIPILRAKKVILIGDHNQLPPTVDKKLLKKLEEDSEKNLSFEDLEILEKSFFEELYEKIPESNKMMLNEQFRMPEQIGNLISTLFYNNSVKNGHIKDTTNFIDSKAIIRWLDVDGEHKLEETSSYNELEVKKIIDLILIIEKSLQKNNTNKSVGIITPYSSQKRRIRENLKDLKDLNISNLKVDTVDSFQGEESDIIIYSTVKTKGNISFLIDKKRLNVAISRTKENLFFIGKKDFFYNAKIKKDEVNLFKEIIDFCEKIQ